MLSCETQPMAAKKFFDLVLHYCIILLRPIH